MQMNLLMISKVASLSSGAVPGGFGNSCALCLFVAGGLSLAIAGYLLLNASQPHYSACKRP